MKKFVKQILLIVILLTSFYYTGKMNDLIIKKTKLMEDINNDREEYDILSVDAVIENDYIIPGINGKSVNVIKSYDNMKELNVFNEEYLKYDVSIPRVSLNNNKSKIVKYGNSSKNQIAILVGNNLDIIKFSDEYNISISRLIDYNTFDKNNRYEQINNDFINYDNVEKMLNNNRMNTNICVVNVNNLDFCKDNNKYLVEATIILKNNNIAKIKNSINSGYYVNLIDYKLLIRQIYYQNLNIVPLSKLISEDID